MLIFVVEGVFSDDSSRPSSQGSPGGETTGEGRGGSGGRRQRDGVGDAKMLLSWVRSGQVLLTVEMLSSSKGVLVLGRKAVEWEWGIWMGSGGGHHRLL